MGTKGCPDTMGKLSRSNQLRGVGVGAGVGCRGSFVSQEEKDARLRYLTKLLDDELYLLNQGSFSPSEVRNGLS